MATLVIESLQESCLMSISSMVKFHTLEHNPFVYVPVDQSIAYVIQKIVKADGFRVRPYIMEHRGITGNDIICKYLSLFSLYIY